jgi:Protein of unknown function (DUF2510)
VSARAGWYPDPGGGQNLFRYWDGRTWSAATTYNPQAAPPVTRLGTPGQPQSPTAAPNPTFDPAASNPTASNPMLNPQHPTVEYGPGAGAYAQFQATQTRRSGVGWWIAAAALVVVIVVVAVIAVRAIGGGTGVVTPPTGGQPSQDVCPQVDSTSPEPEPPETNDGRVHGGPVSYPRLDSPWSAPQTDYRVPFGREVNSQLVTVEPNYDENSNWVASVLVGELQAGDGFFTPEQGAQIVVKCILGRFYGNNEVQSDVRVNKATTIDGNPGWLVESHLTFDIEGLQTKGELLIVAIVATQSTAGLYYASIPDTTPQLVQPARDSLAKLRVDG